MTTPSLNRAARRKRISENRKPGVLDKYNEGLAERGLFLHPTKGYRKLPFRRFLIASLTQDMLEGRGSLSNVAKTAQAYRKARSANADKRARKRSQNPKVPTARSEAPQGPEVLPEAAE